MERKSRGPELTSPGPGLAGVLVWTADESFAGKLRPLSDQARWRLDVRSDHDEIVQAVRTGHDELLVLGADHSGDAAIAIVRNVRRIKGHGQLPIVAATTDYDFDVDLLRAGVDRVVQCHRSEDVWQAAIRDELRNKALARAYASAQTASIELEMRKRLETALEASNEELESAVRERTGQLRQLVTYLENHREREQERVAREIHDEFGQLLSCLRLELDLLQANEAREAVQIDSGLENAQALLDDILDSVRRIVSGLRPRILDELGIIDAIRSMISDLAGRHRLDFRLKIPDKIVQMDSDTATGLFRIVQEAVNNVVRHSGASELNVTIEAEAGSITVMIEDNGSGIPDNLESPGFGLINMRERATALGGKCVIRNRAVGGTALTVSLPTGIGY